MAKAVEVKKAAVEFGDLIGIAVGAGLGWIGGPVGAVVGAFAGYTVAKRVLKEHHSSSSPSGKYHRV